MEQEKSFLHSIVKARCPRCREGEMFPESTLYTRRFADMHESCACCGQPFEPEPGFYYGAMYVSFAFNVAIFIAAMVVLHLFVDEVTMAMMIGVILAVVVGLLPVIFRLSRVIWINIFVRYAGPCSQLTKKVKV